MHKDVITMRKERSPDISIVEEHDVKLQRIFDLLELGEVPSEPSDLVSITQQWAKGDHWTPESRVRSFGTKREKLLELFDSMGLVEPILPPKGKYDHIVVIGALARTNLARLDFVKELIDKSHINLADEGEVFFLGGRRSRNPKELFDLGRQVRIVKGHSELPGIPREIEHLTTPVGRYEAFGSEYDLGQLAVLACFGEAVLSSREITDEHGHDLYTKIRLKLGEDAATTMNILNSPEVHRTHGQARHTTTSSIEELLSRFGGDIHENSRILVVSNNPHIKRIGIDVAEVMKQRGRSDIETFSCGPGAAPSAPTEMFLGEIARLIYLDAQKQ